MELALLVWVISILGKVTAVLICLGVFLGLVSVCHAISAIDSYSPDPDGWKSARKWISISILLFSLSVFIPEQKTAYIMVGAYATQQIAEDPKVQQLGAKTLKLIESKLDEYIQESEKVITK